MDGAGIDYATRMQLRIRSMVVFPVAVVSLCSAHIAYGDTAPCALLTQDQVRTIVGAAVGAGAPIANTGCSWTTTQPPKVVVTVSMQGEKMFAAVKSSSPPNTTKTSIAGLGDEVIFTGVQSFSSLWVKKGTRFLLVRIYGVSVSEAQTKLKAAATNALSKL